MLAALFLGYKGVWHFGREYDKQVEETEFWKGKYFELAGASRDVAKAAAQHTVLTPEEADVALRIIRDTARNDSKAAQ